MRSRSLTMVAIGAVVLTSALPAMATEPEEAAPSGFSGRVHSLPDEDACGLGRLEVVGSVEQFRDGRCESWMGTTDPRFTGTYVTKANTDTYLDTEGALDDGRLSVTVVTHRVENDDGAWDAAASATAQWMPEYDVSWSERTIPTETLVFTGEGDYEGLTAVVWLKPFFANSEVWGFIVHGEPPPAPADARQAVVSA